MTAKEKAEELVNRMMDGFIFIFNKEISKKHALIACDEVLNSNPCCEDSDRGGNFQWASNEYFWQEVKKEIKKL